MTELRGVELEGCGCGVFVRCGGAMSVMWVDAAHGNKASDDVSLAHGHCFDPCNVVGG